MLKVTKIIICILYCILHMIMFCFLVSHLFEEPLTYILSGLNGILVGFLFPDILKKIGSASE